MKVGINTRRMRRQLKRLIGRQLKRAARQQQGFNLIEIMVAITIIGVLMAVVGVNVLGALDGSKQDASKASMGNISNALTMYKLDNGKYPTTSEGLQALLSAPGSSKKPGKKYLNGDSLPKDGWDNEFLYFSPGANSAPFEIKSLGADGQEGGEGTDADLSSSEMTK